MEAIKTKRILEIDLTRGISSFLIPMAHTLLIYGTNYTQSESWLGLSVHFFGKWAGIFLIAMGFSYALSKNNTVLKSMKRGFLLLAAGYFMNFLKFIVPLFLGLIPDNFIEAYGWTPPPTFGQMVYMVLTGDILQFAGMCLLFMGLVNKLVQSFGKWIPIIVTILILISLEFVRGLRIGIPGLDYVLDLLWGDQWNVYFAVFPWFGFILIGMFFGYWFKEVDNNRAFIFKRMLYSGLVTVVIGGVLCYVDYDFHMRDYFHLGIGGFIYLLGFNLLSFWLAHYLITCFKKTKATEFFYYCSRKITTMYIIQWVLICWGMGIFGYNNQTEIGIIFLMILYTILTIVVQLIIDKISLSTSKNNELKPSLSK